jgi:hypothetical protein
LFGSVGVLRLDATRLTQDDKLMGKDGDSGCARMTAQNKYGEMRGFFPFGKLRVRMTNRRYRNPRFQNRDLGHPKFSNESEAPPMPRQGGVMNGPPG